MTWLMPAISSVYPSGAAFATVAAPTTPPAPIWFSMTTFWPQISASRGPSWRATMSAAVPDENGTMIRTGFAG